MGLDIMGLMNDKSKAQATQKYETKEINIGQIIENPANKKIYTTEDIGRLADSIELAGRVLQNLIVKPADENGKYMLIAGHRRWKACNRLVSRGKLEFGSVQCLIENEKDEDLQELMLIYTNSTARDMSDAEKARQAEHATAILTKMKAEKKLEGRVRDIAANMLKTTSSQLARYHAIINNLKDEELRAAFDAGKIGVSIAYEASGLSEEGQHKIALRMRDGSVMLQDVTIEKMKEKAENDPEWAERMERVKQHREEEQEQEENEGANVERREMIVLPKSAKVEVTMITRKTDQGYDTDVDYNVRKGDYAGGMHTVGVFKTISEAHAETIKAAAECHKQVAEALLKAGYIQEMPEKYAGPKWKKDGEYWVFQTEKNFAVKAVVEKTPIVGGTGMFIVQCALVDYGTEQTYEFLKNEFPTEENALQNALAHIATKGMRYAKALEPFVGFIPDAAEKADQAAAEERKAKAAADLREMVGKTKTGGDHYNECLEKMEKVGYENLEPCEQCTIATCCEKCCKECKEPCGSCQGCKVELDAARRKNASQQIFVLKNIVELLQREKASTEAKAGEDKDQGNEEGAENRGAMAEKLGEMIESVKAELEEWEDE